MQNYIFPEFQSAAKLLFPKWNPAVSADPEGNVLPKPEDNEA